MKRRSECICLCHHNFGYIREDGHHCCEPDEVEMKNEEFVSIPVIELEKLEKIRMALYDGFYDNLTTLGKIEFIELTQQVWRVANTKKWNNSADTIKSAFSPELCAQQILDEAIANINTARKEQYKTAMFTDGEVKNGFDMSIKAIERLKEKYNDRK